MTAAIALANLIIPLLPTIGGDIASLINWIKSIRSAAQQSIEWTPAMDQAYRQALIAAGEDASWIPDPYGAAGIPVPGLSSPDNADIPEAMIAAGEAGQIQAATTLKAVQTPPINEAGALETPEKQVTQQKSEIPAPAPATADAPAPSYRHVVGS